MVDSIEIADVIKDLCKDRSEITANDVWRKIGHQATLAHPNGTMGRGFTLAKAAGLIENTGNYVESDHPGRKRGIVAIWRVQ